MNGHNRTIWVGLAVLLALSANLAAQTTLGTILGTASDATGAAIPGVTVVVRNTATNIEQRTTTNGDGSYEVMNLIPGQYAVTAEAAGFKKVTVSGIVLETAATVRADLQLQVGDVSTSVTVEASAPLINTEAMDIANIRTNEALERLPVNVRGNYNGAYYNILVLTPGAQTGTDGTVFSFGGTMGQQFGATIDGTTTTSTLFGNGTGTAQSSLDATAELRVQLANDKAESGMPGGFYATTKSGGNTLHGTLFWYHTNSHLVARNTFSATVPFRLENDYGASLGGPIFKNRTFFFVLYERFPRRTESNMRPNVPTVKMRAGDFSALLPSTVVRDPLTGQPFAGNLVPAQRLNATSLKIQEKFFPLPNTGSPDNYQNNWQGTEHDPNFKTQVEGRIDHKLTSANSLFGRWSWNRGGYTVSRGSLPTIPLSHEDRRTTVLTISDSHLFSPTLYNEFRFGLMRTRQPIEGINLDGPALIDELGLQGYPSTFLTKSGMPYFTFTGFQAISISTPSPFQNPQQRTHQVVDNVTWTRGAHTFKTGLDLRFNSGINFPGGTYFPAQAYGTFGFTGAFSGFSYVDFLLGLPQTSSRGNAAPAYDMINTDLAAFVQDDWKVSRNLTLNLGLRYSFNPPYHERSGRFFHFDAATGRVVLPNADARQYVNPLFPVNLAPIALASDVGLPASLFYSELNDFVPRLGFAYRPWGTGRTVIRGGYGLYTDLSSAGLWGGSTGGPFVSNESFTNTIANGVPRFAFPKAFPEGFGAIGAQSFSDNDPHLTHAYIQQWSLTIEHEVFSTGFRLSYIGTGSRNIPWGPNINQPVPGLQPFNNNMRRFPALQNVTYRQNGGTQQYQSLHLVAERKMKTGLYYQLGWTWAKNLTDIQSDGEGGSTPANSYARNLERADMNYMPAQRLVGNLIYDLPVGHGRSLLSNMRGWQEFILGGWILTGMVNAETGKFFNPTFSGFDVSNTNSIGGRPDRIGDGNLPVSQRTLDHWFDASAFRVPGDLNGDGRPDVAVGRFGNCAPNILIGPGLLNFNGGLHKEYPVKERVRVLIQGTFTNLFNHANYSNPSANISAPASVGRITSAASARSGVVALRIEF